MRSNGLVASNPPSRLGNLQLLRALAAFSVVMQHAIHDSWSLAAAPQAGTGRYLLNFEFGVDVFFVISGFIMAHTMAADFGTPGAPRRFLLRRCARIIPLYWLLTTLLILGGTLAPALLNVPLGSAWHIVASYLFIPDARVTGEVRPVLALGWTLDYEMAFYVLFAVALTLPIKRGVLWLSVAMASLALVHAVASPSATAVAYWTNPIILEFLFGIYVAMIFRSGRRIGGEAAFLVAAVGLTGYCIVPPHGDESDFLLRFIATGVPAAFLVLAAALGPAIGDKPALSWAVALGNASYSLYLVHPFVVRPFRALWSHFVGARLPVAFYIAACCIVSALVALVLYRTLERPLTTFVQGLAGRRGSRASQPTEALVVTRPQP